MIPSTTFIDRYQDSQLDFDNSAQAHPIVGSGCRLYPMARHSGSAENRDHRATSSSRSSQREQTHLPPISQAIPEIGWTHPAHANIADYRRRLDHNPQGPTPSHTSRSLAPPSGSSSKSTSRPTLEVPAPQPRSRHETPSSSSTRSMPIHSGPPHRKSGSSSSSDFSSNRRTSNTSPSTSPHDSSGHRLPPRKPSLERLKRDEVKPRRPQNNHTSLPRSPCDSYPSHAPAPAPPPQWSGYGHQPVSPVYSLNPRYQAGHPAVMPHPGYQVAPSPYVAYPGPQPDMKAYAISTGQQPYAAAYPSMDGDEPRSKKRRGNLPKWQTDLMRSWYDAHIRNPYPTESEKHQMVRSTGLTLEQVSNWFINCRRRHGPQLSKDAEAESMLRRAHAESSQGSTEPSPRIKEPSPRQRYKHER